MSEPATTASKRSDEDLAATGDSAYEALLALAFASRQSSEQAPPPEPVDLEQAKQDTAEPDTEEGSPQSVSGPFVDGLATYRDRINRIPLLTQAEERDLAWRIEAGVFAAEALFDGAPRHLQDDLSVIWQRGAEAYNHFVSANLRLVVYWVSRYRPPGLEFDDAIQEGNLGLLRAVQMFDSRKGYKFSTYASWWIKQYLSRAAADQGRTIRLPVHVHERLYRLQRALKTAGSPTLSGPVLEMANVAKVEAEDLLKWARPMWSLDELIDHGFLLDSPVEPLFEGDLRAVLEDTATRATVGAALLHLSARQREVLELRYGLVDGISRTLEEVGAHFALTRERIRQIESKAREQLSAQTCLLDLWKGQ